MNCGAFNREGPWCSGLSHWRRLDAYQPLAGSTLRSVFVVVLFWVFFFFDGNNVDSLKIIDALLSLFKSIIFISFFVFCFCLLSLSLKPQAFH